MFSFIVSLIVGGSALSFLFTLCLACTVDVHALRAWGARRDKKRAVGPLELELQL